MKETQRARRGHNFYPPKGITNKIPALLSTDGQGKEATVWLHYFHPAGDWWVTELDPETGEAFGYACITEGEFGYMFLPELEAARNGINVIERDLYWEPCSLSKALEAKGI